MALNEHSASVLGRFHRALSPCRWQQTLVAAASGFAAAEHIRIGGNGAFDVLYRTHLRRVQGRGSPRECDQEFHRLVTGGQSDTSRRPDARSLEGSQADQTDAGE